MKTQKHKGFSLAEVLISLMLVSILVAVSAPVLSKKNTSADSAWQWSLSGVKNGGVYKGDQVLIGPDKPVPFGDDKDEYGTNFFSALNVLAGSEYLHSNALASQLSAARGFPFEAVANIPLDTMVISKPVLDIGGHQRTLASSHIAFYTMGNTAGSIEYAGRLAGDEYNLALGIASLQSHDDTGFGGQGRYNTALGHYALLGNSKGMMNTAVGYNIFSSGSENTAVGSGVNNVKTGRQNTVIGHVTGSINGNNNIILGNVSKNISSNNNILIGNNAGSGFDKAGSWARLDLDNSGNMLAIGNVTNSSGGKDGIELIQAKLANADGNPSRLVVNGDFIVKSRDGQTTLFKVDGSGNSRQLLSNDTMSNYWIKYYSRLFDKEIDFIKSQAGQHVISPDCDGAKVCIAKFNMPQYSNAIVVKSGNQDLYDIYIEGMKAKLDGGCGAYSIMCSMATPYIATLRQSLWYFDRYKENNSALYYLFDDIGNKVSEIILTGEYNIDDALEDNKTTLREKYCGRKYDRYRGDCGSLQLICKAIRSSCGGYWHSPNSAQADYVPGVSEEPSVSGNTPAVTNEDCSVYGLLQLSEKKACEARNKYRGYTEAQCNDLLLLSNRRACKDAIYSDVRLKNVKGDSSCGLDKINKLEVKNYTYKFDKEQKPHVGVIAQQLQKIFPTAVSQGKDGFLKIRLDEIFYAMVNAVKELTAKNNVVQEKISVAIEKIKYIQEQNKLLKAENKLLQKQNKEFEKRIKKLQKEQKNK